MLNKQDLGTVFCNRFIMDKNILYGTGILTLNKHCKLIAIVN